ncbi:hypothetical protein [Luteimonas sp. A277]
MDMNVAYCSERPATGTASNVLVQFGPDDRLTGVLAGAHGSGPTLLLPSAGLQPRAGPFRLHVELAERLAASGIRSFRYDIPGVGEAPRLAGCDAVGATRAAMDALESRHGCRTFAVGGVCSAADTGWEVASLDSRVSALLLLDGICFAGPWYAWARMIGLLRRLPAEWPSFARKLQSRMRGGAGLDSGDFRTWPDRARARREFEQLLQRDARLLFIFSGGYEDRFLHPRQFAWTFGPLASDPRVVMHYWPESDHTYFGRIQRDRLIATIDQWMVGLAAGVEP